MAGHLIVTDLDAKTALATARDIARELGFSVTRTGDWEFQAEKGNFPLSIFLGAFIAYCNFKVEVALGREAAVEIVITRNSPWWTGIIGVNRVKNRVKELADEIAKAVIDQGGRILREKVI